VYPDRRGLSNRFSGLHIPFSIFGLFRGCSPLYIRNVDKDVFSDAALVLLGHGSTANAESATALRRQAAELHRRGCFAQVSEAFWKQEPRVKFVLPALTTQRVFIVPMFISEGYFSEEVIPRELGFEGFSRLQQRGEQRLFYCRPVGTHEGMTAVLLARARGVLEQFPFPRAPKPQETTLFIAGHGTERNENSRRAIERQVEQIRSIHLYAEVHSVFLEEEPRIAECYRIARTRNIVLVPFFISNGLHAQEDIPVMLGEPEHVVQKRLQAGQPVWRNPTERNGKLVWYSSCVGDAPGVADVILERVREAARW
jgi:sirohydrochlorin cobaltochelatase